MPADPQMNGDERTLEPCHLHLDEIQKTEGNRRFVLALACSLSHI
jgi:hypothetical protein